MLPFTRQNIALWQAASAVPSKRSPPPTDRLRLQQSPSLLASALFSTIPSKTVATATAARTSVLSSIPPELTLEAEVEASDVHRKPDHGLRHALQ